MESTPLLSLQKCWLHQIELLWQASLGRGRKGYLAINPQQLTSVRWVTEKPNPISLTAAHPLINLIRKHTPSARLGAVWENPTTQEWWIQFASQGLRWHLWIEGTGKERQLHLISPEKEDLVRFGEKGTFTKKKKWEGNLPLEKPAGFSLWSLPSEAPEEEIGKEEGSSTADVPDIPAYQRRAKDQLKRKLRTIRKSLARIEGQLPLDPQILLQEAKWLQTYGYRIHPETTKLYLEAEEIGRPTGYTLSIDSEKTIGAQIEARFHAAKKSKKTKEIFQSQWEKTNTEKEAIEKDLDAIREIPMTCSEVEKILLRYHIAPPPEKSPSVSVVEKEALPYRVFYGESDAEFLVGKSPSDNDSLTKMAKANDYWFHVVGSTGSHVIVPARTLPGREMTETVQRQAAIYALHFSKIRQAREGEVYCTQRRHVRKKKGLPVGMWLVDQSKTLWVRYEAEELASFLIAHLAHSS